MRHLRRADRQINRKEMSVKKMGRPPALDNKRIEDFLKLLSIGVKVSIALDYVGIPSSTYYDWLKRGDEERDKMFEERRDVVTDEKPFVEFSDKVRRSKAHFVVKHMLQLDEVAKKSPEMRLTLLRNLSEDFNPALKVDAKLSAGDGGSVTILIRDATEKDIPERTRK